MQRSAGVASRPHSARRGKTRVTPTAMTSIKLQRWPNMQKLFSPVPQTAVTRADIQLFASEREPNAIPASQLLRGRIPFVPFILFPPHDR